MPTNNNQFRAKAGQVYRNPESGQTVSYSEEQLKNPAIGNLSQQFKPYTPQSSPGTGVDSGNGGADQTLDSLTEGIVDPMDLPDVRKSDKFEVARQQLTEQAEATYDPQILRTKQVGRGQVSSAEGITGQRQGQNLSTAEISYINQNIQQVETQVKDLEQQKQAFISEGLFEYAKSLSDQQVQAAQMKNDLVMQKASLALQLRGQEQQEEEFEFTKDLSINELRQNVPAGETVEVGGITYEGLEQPEVDPFFKGSDIARLMVNIPAEESREITDPNTGETYTVTGLSQEDENIKSVSSYDDQGNLSITRYNMDTGEVLGQTKVKGVGKSKSGPSMVSVQYPRQSKDPLYNQEGEQVGYAVYNPIAGTTMYKNLNNKPIEFPEGGSVGKVTSDDEDTGGYSDIIKWIEGKE